MQLIAQAVAWVSGTVRSVLTSVLRYGPVPEHIAFIMDGNRRFATKQGLKRIQGHEQGYLKLLDALQWSLDLGVKSITVYAFSIDNFRRESQEVGALMVLAEHKLLDILQHQKLITNHRVQVRVLGDLSLLPDCVQQAASRVMAETSQNDACFLNICMAYTSQQEIAHAVLRTQEQVALGQISLDDVTADTLSQNMYTQGCPPVDLLIRTSGEHRLSDFLLWQSHFALLSFSDTLWPDYSFWDLLQALVQYQLSYPKLQELAAVRHPTAARQVEELSQEKALPLQTGKAQHGIHLIADVSKGFLQSSVDLAVGLGVTDAETSDSSVSSDSQSASRSTSPLHNPAGRRGLCQSQAQQKQQQPPSTAQTVSAPLAGSPLYRLEQGLKLQEQSQPCPQHEMRRRHQVLQKQTSSSTSSQGQCVIQEDHAGTSV